MLPGGHFLFLPRGWSVDIRDGQYRAVWHGGSMARSQPGNEGWSVQEGQPPVSSVTQERLTPAEESVLPRSPGANRYGWKDFPESFPDGLVVKKNARVVH